MSTKKPTMSLSQQKRIAAQQDGAGVTVQSKPTGYHISDRRSITIFGGYAVREILDPKGNHIITVAVLGRPEEDLPKLDNLINHLNRKV